LDVRNRVAAIVKERAEKDAPAVPQTSQ